MDWPHSPLHRIVQAGVYIVTCGTYGKEHFFRGPERLTLLTNNLLVLADKYEWRMQAWSVMSNHYHFVSMSAEAPNSLARFLGHLHTVTAKAVNELDNTPGRKVWFQYWDTLITYEKAFLARLNYAHNNPVKHGLVDVATKYPWCSASWFEQKAETSFYKTVSTFNTDRISIRDEFSPL